MALNKFFLQFVNFNESELDQLNQLAKPEQISKGEALIKRGQVCDKLYFVTKGILRLGYTSEKGEEVVLDFVFQDSFAVDYVSFLLQQPTEMDIIAVQDCQLLSFERKSIHKLYEENIKFQKMGRLISEFYFIRFAERIKENSLPPKERYDKLVATNGELLQKIPQYLIASYLGISAEWLSKLRAKK
ncbi:MAG: Crp/Fnr family transcriptional regulator [Bacteroidetes bacterium]|nr:Crp/Fnr family transcriptional regulator [Bacteroidota bacterium]